MSSALVIAGLSSILLAQAGATDISQIGGGAASSPATVSPLQTPQAAGPGSASQVQVTPEGARSSRTDQVGASGRDAKGPDQVGKRDRSSATTQVTNQRRTASAPASLSSVREGHVVSTVVVHGRDRCNPVAGQPLPEDCANIVDQRPDDFAPPPPTGLTADETVVAGSLPRGPSVNDIYGLTNNLTGANGGEAALAAGALGVVTQTLPSSTANSPVLGTAVSATVNAAASGVGATSLPGGIVVTVTPAPK